MRMESRPTLTLFGVASSGSGKCKQIHVVFPFFLYLSFKSLRPGRHKDVTMCWIVSINVVNGQCEAFQAIGQGPFWWRNDDDTAVIMIVIQHSSHLNLKGRQIRKQDYWDIQGKKFPQQPHHHCPLWQLRWGQYSRDLLKTENSKKLDCSFWFRGLDRAVHQVPKRESRRSVLCKSASLCLLRREWWWLYWWFSC